MQAQKHVKSGPITDSAVDLLFLHLAVDVSRDVIAIGVELGLPYKVLWNELETGKSEMWKGSDKALKMLHLWRNSVPKDDCTYSRLAAALEKRGFHDAALKYCCD